MTTGDYQYNVNWNATGTATVPTYQTLTTGCGGYTDQRGLWQTYEAPVPYVRNTIYCGVIDAISRIAREHGADAHFVISTSPEDLGVAVCVGISRGEEIFELDFGRIIAMLERQGTLDLDWSEVERYIATTCALLPPGKQPPYDASLAKLAQIAQMQSNLRNMQGMQDRLNQNAQYAQQLAGLGSQGGSWLKSVAGWLK